MFRLSTLSAAATCLLATATVVSSAPLVKRDVCLNSNITRNCWTDGFDIFTDSDSKWPDTGRTVSYDFEITNSTVSPDGVDKQMFLINGQYPGPTVEADWGDTVCISVKNSLSNNGTGIHWHGIRQYLSNTQDGAPGITECPIAPGESKQYCFKATQYGTSWYHSHLSSQYGQGIVGAVVIHGPASYNYDIDLGTLTLADYYYKSMFQVQSQASFAAGPPTADTILINGSMTSASGGGYTRVKLEPGKKHLLRFINTGINNYFHVALDGHQFVVVAADFNPIMPYRTDSIVIAVGQRYDVVIDASQTASAYWLRVGPGGDGSATSCDGPVTNRDSRAVFTYAGTDDNATPSSTGITLPLGCSDEAVTPVQNVTVPAGTLSPELELGFVGANATSPVFWTINRSALKVDWKNPSLAMVKDGNTSFPTSANVQDVPAGSGWTYWVIQEEANIAAPLPHPIHLHGHDFYILAQGTGDYTAATLKYSSPIRRDTATLDANGYLILAFKTDNPGAWLMHCHIPFHSDGGLALQFLERKEEISSSMDLGAIDGQCQNWQTWWAANGQDEIGSGI